MSYGKMMVDSMSGKNADLEKRFGVEQARFGKMDNHEEWQSAKESRDNYKERMIEGARNDYDLRQTMSSAARSGKKKAIELEKKGFTSVDDVRKWQNFSEKAAARHGQGGAFDSASDYMGLTKSMEIRDRRKQTDAINNQVNSLRDEFMAKLSAQEKKEAQVPDEKVTTQTSSRLADARNAVSEMENGMFSGVNQHTAPDEGQQNDSLAQQMLAEKKKQIADRLKPANPAGL